MTNTIFSIVFLTTIMMTAAIAASIEFIPEADALKSKGSDAPGRVGTSSFGSKTARIVCGGVLCSEYPGGYDQWQKDKGQSAKIGAEAVEPEISKEVPAIPEEPMMEEVIEEVAPGSVLRLSRANVPALLVASVSGMISIDAAIAAVIIIVVKNRIENIVLVITFYMRAIYLKRIIDFGFRMKCYPLKPKSWIKW